MTKDHGSNRASCKSLVILILFAANGPAQWQAGEDCTKSVRNSYHRLARENDQAIAITPDWLLECIWQLGRDLSDYVALRRWGMLTSLADDQLLSQSSRLLQLARRHPEPEAPFLAVWSEVNWDPRVEISIREMRDLRIELIGDGGEIKKSMWAHIQASAVACFGDSESRATFGSHWRPTLVDELDLRRRDNFAKLFSNPHGNAYAQFCWLVGSLHSDRVVVVTDMGSVPRVRGVEDLLPWVLSWRGRSGVPVVFSDNHLVPRHSHQIRLLGSKDFYDRSCATLLAFEGVARKLAAAGGSNRPSDLLELAEEWRHVAAKMGDIASRSRTREALPEADQQWLFSLLWSTHGNPYTVLPWREPRPNSPVVTPCVGRVEMTCWTPQRGETPSHIGFVLLQAQ